MKVELFIFQGGCAELSENETELDGASVQKDSLDLNRFFSGPSLFTYSGVSVTHESVLWVDDVTTPVGLVCLIHKFTPQETSTHGQESRHQDLQ